jgi:hypothetical protein
MKNVRIIASLVKVISSVIRSIKRDKEDGGAISARPVKRLSVQQREHHTIDSTNLAQSSMRWFK